MTADPPASTWLSGALLWVAAVAVTAFVFDAAGVVPESATVAGTAVLVGSGGVLAVLVFFFVRYFADEEGRLF